MLNGLKRTKKTFYTLYAKLLLKNAEVKKGMRHEDWIFLLRKQMEKENYIVVKAKEVAPTEEQIEDIHLSLSNHIV